MSKYTKISKNIHKLEINNPNSEKKIVWTNIITPGKKEIEFLRKNDDYNFALRELQISSSKAISQRPMILKRDGYFFLILHFPVLKDNEVINSEIDFFIGHEFLITLHNNETESLDKFFNYAKKNDSDLLSYKLESSAILLYELLKELIIYSYTLIDENHKKIDEIEDIIFKHQQKQATSKILELRRDIINLRRIIQSHKNILKKLMEIQSSLISENEIKHCYFELIEHTKRVWEYSENQKESIEALYDTNESMLNYSINNVMKTLTVLSVIVFPLTLFAALFGMNTTNGMPFTKEPNGFWLIVAIMAVATVIMVILFKKKKWL